MRNPPNLSIAFLFMFLLFGWNNGLKPFWPPTIVTMTNSLGGQLLTVHCKSKDDDLGVHKVPSNANYHFQFQTNIWKSTMFYCSFGWNNQVKWFNIFEAERDQDICYTCDWSIKVDGPCRLGKKEPKCFPWK